MNDFTDSLKCSFLVIIGGIIVVTITSIIIYGFSRAINDNVSVKIDNVEVYRGNKVCTSYKSVGNRTKVEYSNKFFCNNPEYIITDKKIEIETIK